jgi:general secretion pathway protein K
MLHKQQGSALVSALMIILMIASICTLWVTETHFQILSFHRRQAQQEAIWLSKSIQFWAVNQLQGKKIQQISPVIATTKGQGFGLAKGWHIDAKLIDAQSMFNFNSITEQSMKISYYLLLKHLLKQNEVQDIFYASISWLQHNQKSEIYNSYYAKLPVPYQNSEQMLVSLDELGYIKGYTSKVIMALKPYLTTLPESTPININTANDKIIQILKPNLRTEDVKKIIYARGSKGFRSTGALFAILESFKIPPANITIHSQYFWLEYEISSPDKRKLIGKCLFYRPLIEKKSFPKQVIMVHEFTIN